MDITYIFRDNGYKVTATRRAVLSWIAEQNGIFSAKEIMAVLPKLDKVSVYRTLELLESIDAIHPVLTQHGETHYEIHGTNHHHHVVCTGCEKANCVDCEISRTKAKGFTNLHHNVVFTGLCNACVV